MAAIIFWFLIKAIFLTSTSAMQCGDSKTSEYGYRLLDSAFVSFEADDIGTCFGKCLADKRCNSINYDLESFLCEHNYLTKTVFPLMFVRKEYSVYAETRKPDYGSSANIPSPSCRFIKEKKPQAKSGLYWIRLILLGSNSSAFQVYCDMQTDQGGWTLVYSYFFTNFTFFSSLGNAVAPIPSWPVNELQSRLSIVSKQVPLNEWTYAAMDFPLWKKIGSEFLVKSTISHWIACTSGTGNLVAWKQGTIHCRSIKHVAKVCEGHVPTKFEIISYCGPALRDNNGRWFYFFDGSIWSCYPTHDPCGTSLVTNHRKDVQVPEGSLYIR